MVEVKRLAYSVAPTGKRLLTVQVTMPRFILAQFNTHRMTSKNAASSRAIPSAKLIERVRTRPVMPVEWGLNQPGMVADKVAEKETADRARYIWAKAAMDAAQSAEQLAELGIHKQVVNRILEPFLTVTVIASGTEWANFFHLRCDHAAQPEFQAVAEGICRVWYEETPDEMPYGAVHLPLIEMEDIQRVLELGLATDTKDTYYWLSMVSAGRCARVSYLTHEGVRDVYKDIELAERLSRDGHWSPFEHQATPMKEYEAEVYSGNFQGWRQFRQTFADQDQRTYKARLEDYLPTSP